LREGCSSSAPRQWVARSNGCGRRPGLAVRCQRDGCLLAGPLRTAGELLPVGEAERAVLALQVRTGGFALLEAVYRPDAPDWPRRLPAVQVLRRA
jgi:hypothetical protein